MTMDVRLINPFILATRKVFEVFANVEAQASAASAVRKLPSLPGSVNALIEMSGGATGALLLRFPAELVMPVARIIDPTAEALQDGMDAIGEIANIVTGNAKRKLTHRIVDITIPRIVIDKDTLRRIEMLTPWLIVPFELDAGTFQLAVSCRVHETESAQDEAISAALSRAG